VTAGEIVTCAVDLAMIHDSGGPRRVAPILKRFGVGLWDPGKVVLISDHYVPAGDDETRRIGEVTAIRGRQQAGFYDGEGIARRAGARPS
jgi:3-isopropylmalate/(R)-2-methylmalate dehydratase large subunit